MKIKPKLEVGFMTTFGRTRFLYKNKIKK